MSEDFFKSDIAAQADRLGRESVADSAFRRCIALLEAGDPRAGDALQDLLARFPTFAPGWQDLGQWLMQAGKPEAALACLRRALAAAPSAPLAIACGQACRTLGRDAEAFAAFAEACRLEPRSTRAAFLLGLTAQDRKDYEAASLAYRRALALDPALPEAWTNLGIVLQATGDLSGAKHAYGAALRVRRDSFGRIAQALAAAPKGELWLDLEGLRRDLAG